VTERLPRGRHQLSRAEVADRQRGRMLDAVTEVLAERGYVDTPVAAIIERAGVSRETFYQLFASKQDCFIAALEQAVAGLAAGLDAASGGRRGEPIERFGALLDTYLAALAAQPARARLFLIETYAAGPEAMRRRLELQDQFVTGIARIFRVRSRADRLACEALVGAVVAMVTARFMAGDPAGVRAVREPIVQLAAARFPQGR
jgi:AcrR family transcriptional regulator